MKAGKVQGNIAPSAFDVLFTKNVPHLLEKIFFCLDYKSFKACRQMSNAWNELLTSESFLKMRKSVFRRGVLKDETKLWNETGKGNTDEVRQLLSGGLLNVNMMNHAKNSVLSLVALRGHCEIVQFLMDYGADPNTAGSKGNTALHVAANNGYKQVAQCLIARGVEINITTNDQAWELGREG